MDDLTYWVNGVFVPAGEAVMPLNCRGYRLGDGVFDTERTFNGTIFKLDAHLKRLERSLKVLRIDLGMPMEELARAAEETVERNRHLLETHGDYWVTQTVHRGGGKNPSETGSPFISIIVEPLAFGRFAPHYTAGAHLIIPSARVSARGGMDPKLKAISRLSMVLADLETHQADPSAWSLTLDEEGNLAEVFYGNLFLVRDGTIRTPTGRAILEGITRETTIGLARERSLEVREENLQPYDLYTADEAFITTTSYCILPVARLNGSPVGKEMPGPITRQLTEAWNGVAGFDIAEQMRVHAARAEPVAPASAAR